MKHSGIFFLSFFSASCRFPCLQLLLLIGAKLEHVINKLAYEVASKHAAGQGEGGHRRAPFRRAVLVPQPPARARPHPLHPVSERIRVRVFLLDNGEPASAC